MKQVMVNTLSRLITWMLANKRMPAILNTRGRYADPAVKTTGSGIGLSLSKQIMRQHEGNITVKSELGKGTEFLLRF
jgi:signal transduction histidine kinase